ncbi:4-hydroxy-tetrahydrodipicolinate reductase [Candidatus Bathycorpusculum sp.]|uniref:4-hydroxy-tetrahydrodipicolinate reductase n=1 Tax=Candidatus Bathycorpusculum sp. TaxID=2994959 RepID=UPI002836F139|nr:4-hydroxy-tetrahydrodipicolinate reductase [Candidatus Termitimicrobium sp.]MCL2431097.1 4-hydroxy-tetrahydrodipicolinate reductase [Candidatus Termitimicrobium sp.]
MLKLCIAGAAGRMGQAIIAEALAKGHQITGATEAPNCPALGKSLCDFGINSDTKISADINKALQDADIFISFTTPAADLINIPAAVGLGKRIILGTTGFTADQSQKVVAAMSDKVPVVFSPNYSVGINILFKLAEQLKVFPQGYDFSINEIHHVYKTDAPSGTAKKLGEIIANVRGYTETVSGREGINPRQPHELEVTTHRAGGIAGIHNLIIAGPNEMLRIEHTAFSRNVFAQGAVYAAEWISHQTKPQIYSMADVLGLN